jgi:hypothetical protein
MTVVADSLPDDPGTLKAMLIAERVQNERLRQIVKELQRHRFGRRAETLSEDQTNRLRRARRSRRKQPIQPSGQAEPPSSDEQRIASQASVARRGGGRYR